MEHCLREWNEEKAQGAQVTWEELFTQVDISNQSKQ